mgnify:CR=1 FL=1
MVPEFVPGEDTESIIVNVVEEEQNMEQDLNICDGSIKDAQVGSIESEQKYVSPEEEQSESLENSNEECTVWLSKGLQLPTCPVVIGSSSCRALLDSGSNVSFISEDYCTKEGLVIKPSNHVIQGLGGQGVSALGVVQVAIQLGAIVLDFELIVLPAGTMFHYVLLGSNFFAAHGITLDVAKQRLKGCSTWGSWEIYYHNEVKTVFRQIEVQVEKETIIPWGESVKVEISLPESVRPSVGAEFYFDGSLSAGYLHGVPGVLTVSEDPLFLLIYKAAGRHSHEKLQPGRVIGTLATLVECEVPEVEVSLSSAGTSAVIDEAAVDHLCVEEKGEVTNLLKKCASAFSKGDEDIGCAGVTEHMIELYDDTPIRQKPRRFPEPVSREIERQCEELKKLDIIDYSKSPWSSPIVPVRKPDGTIRMCIDYRQVNKVTKADRFPIPSVNDLVFGLHGMKYFTTLDLVKGYYQVRLHPDCQEYTAFSTSKHHYQFKRLSFGLKNAPGAFQREMQEVLRDFDRKQVLVYIDDILIMSEDFDEHVILVEKVLNTLIEYNIRVKMKKCCWFAEEVKFLGHMVSQRGLRKCDSYMSIVRDFKKPTTVKELRSFLGLVNFQRKFIPDCAVRAKPLTVLTGKKDKFKLQWTEEMDKAFEDLKEAICAHVELSYPDYSEDAEKLELSTDASGFGAGACLTQVQSGETRVIAYASMCFSPAQRNYSTIERELAAIRWAVHTFRSFLFGVPFVLFTDHRPLVYMHTMSQQKSRLMRTLNELAEFDFEVKYKAGKDNTIADTLSRLGGASSSLEDVEEIGLLPPGLGVFKITPGGGDSMIESLLTVLRLYQIQYNERIQIPDTALEFRQLLTDELLRRPEFYGVPSNRTALGKVRLLKLPGQPPSDLFLRSFANLFQLQVVVHYGMTRPVIFTPSQMHVAGEDEEHRVHLQCLGGVHYNPARVIASYRFTENCAVEDSIDKLEEVEGEEVLEVSTAICTNVDLPCNHQGGYTCTTIVKVNESRYCAVFDTGAQVSLVTETAFQRISELTNLEVCRSDIAIRSFGNIVHAKGSIDLAVELPGTDLITVTCYIVPDEVMTCCLLFGIDVIRDFGIQLDFATNSLRTYSGSDVQQMDFLHCNRESESLYCFLQETAESLQIGALLDRHQIILMQKGDDAVRSLSEVVLEKIPVVNWQPGLLDKFRRYASQFLMQDGVLSHQRDATHIPVASFGFLVEIAIHVHYQLCHPGQHKLMQHLRVLLWHPSLAEVVRDICSSCPICQKCKVSSNVPAPPLVKIKAENPFDLMSADLLKLPRTSTGYEGCLVIVDHCSKWLTCIPIRDKRALTVTQAFEHRAFPSFLRKPVRLLTDNGGEFTSLEFEEMLKRLGVRHVYSSPCRPASNGAVERLNRTILEMLRCVSDQDVLRWDTLLAKVVVSYNSSFHSQISMSPSKFLLRKEHSLTEDGALNCGTREVWKEGHPNFTPFEVGDLVLKKTIFRGHLASNKMIPRFSGPFKVTKVRGTGLSYEIEVNSKTVKVHHDHLRKWYQIPGYISESAHLKQVMGSYVNNECDKTVEISQESDESSDEHLHPPDFSGFVGSSSSSEGDSGDDDFPVGIGFLGSLPLHPISEAGTHSDFSDLSSQSSVGHSQTQGNLLVRAAGSEACVLDRKVNQASESVVSAVGFSHSTPVIGLDNQVRSPEVSPIQSVVDSQVVEELNEVWQSLVLASELHELEIARIGSLLEEMSNLFVSGGSSFSGFLPSGMSLSETLVSSSSKNVVSLTPCTQVTSVIGGLLCSVVGSSKLEQIESPVVCLSNHPDSPLASSTPVVDATPVSSNRASLGSCPFLESPCSGCVPVNKDSITVNSVPFQGFSPPSQFAARDRLNRLKSARRDLGLAPVKAQIAESKRILSEFRQRSRDRIHSLSHISFRRTSTPNITPVVPLGVSGMDALSSVVASVSASVVVSDTLVSTDPSPIVGGESTPICSRPFTRSRGPVRDFENVQAKILEYRPRKL